MFSYVWGPAPDFVGGRKYYVSFVDDFSKFTWVYLLKKKSEVFKKFLDFQQLVERLFDLKIISMQTDWGGEYEKLHTFFLPKLALVIMSHARMLINKMDPLNTNIDILLRLAYLFLLMLLCL